ncbi:myosin light chain 5-like [Lycorma delicatula]|uniref:myosin light chain 5-like n=1 Tax=Lycorma delicatula TaxID=130591 RepID=UPI003F50E0ED
MSDQSALQPPEQPPKEKKKKKSGVKSSDLPKTESKKSAKTSEQSQSNEAPLPAEDTEKEAEDTVPEPAAQTEATRKKSIMKNDEKQKRRESKSLLEVDYVAPPAASKKDIDLLHNIDEEKMRQLKEAFLMFDFNHDGVIGREDLKTTLTTMGRDDVTDEEVDVMLSEALYPLDFDAFVVLLGCKTIELDPEEVIRDALSRWDYDGSGWINEQRIRHDLMTWGDKFTPEEVDIALEDAPVHDDFRETADQRMIDYVKFCKILCGLRAKTD